MASPFGQYLNDRQRKGSVILPAGVLANRADGDVDVKIRHTGKTVRASKGNTAGTYTPGQLVQVSRTDASGVTSNTGWVIIGPPPSSMKGTSKFAPLDEAAATRGAAVTRIVPNPVLLVPGGDVVTVTLYGAFAGVPSVSFSNSELLNDVPPAGTSTQITLEVRASSSAVPGDYDLLLDDTVVAPELFQVSAASGAGVPAHSVWLFGYDPSNAVVVVRLDASDMSVFSITPLPVEAVNTGDMKLIAGRIVARGSTAAISIANSGLEDSITGLALDCQDIDGGVWGDKWVGGSSSSPTTILSRLDASPLAESTTACNTEFSSSCDVDGDTAWMSGDNPTKLIEFDLAGSSEVRRQSLSYVFPADPLHHGVTPHLILHDATYLYTFDDDKVFKFDKVTLDIVSFSAATGHFPQGGRTGGYVDGGNIIYSTLDAVIVMDAATLTIVTAISIAHSASGIYAGLAPDTVFLADTDYIPGSGVSVVNLLTSIVTRTALPPG